MNLDRKSRVADLNPTLLCVLCGGYYIDATTIIECLHSFCKACIVRYLETSKYCPICDVQVHKTKPLQNIRADSTLQNIVYKVIPGLYQNEMLRRRDFYAKYPDSKPLSCEDGGVMSEKSCIYAPDESICLSLEYLDSQKELSKDSFARRFLRCPAAVTISHIQKLIRAKFSLSPEHKVDILYMGEALPENLTLMDIAYIYSWRRKGPLHLHYCILENRIKRRKFNHNSLAKTCSMDFAGANSSKLLDADFVDSLQIVLSTQDAKEMDCSVMNNNNSVSRDEENKRWKEVQIQISENGVMSVMNISSESNNNSYEVHEEFQAQVAKNVELLNKSDIDSNIVAESIHITCEERKVHANANNSELLHDNSKIDCSASNTSQQNKINCAENKNLISEIHKTHENGSIGASEKTFLHSAFSTSKIGANCNSLIRRISIQDSPVESSSNFAVKKSLKVCSVNEQNHSPVKAPVKAFHSDVKCSKESISSQSNFQSNPVKSNAVLISCQKMDERPILSNFPDDNKNRGENLNKSRQHTGVLGSKSSQNNNQVSSSLGKISTDTEGGKICSNDSPQKIIFKKHAENLNSSSKSACSVKTRNVPRFLGNPASRVQRMFQPVVTHVQNINNNSNSKFTPALLKTNRVTVTKIDPNTSANSSISKSVNTLTASHTNNLSMILPGSHNSSPVSSSIKILQTHPQAGSSSISNLKGNDTIPTLSNTDLSIKPKEVSSKINSNVSDFLAKTLPQTSSSSKLSNIPKNAHLLYVFSESNNRLSGPLLRPVGPHVVTSAMGAFHPLPPSVNMLFNPLLQQHKLQNHCSIRPTINSTPVERVESPNFKQKHCVDTVKDVSVKTCYVPPNNMLPTTNEDSNRKHLQQSCCIGTCSSTLCYHENVYSKGIRDLKSYKENGNASRSSVCNNVLFPNLNTCSSLVYDVSSPVTLAKICTATNTTLSSFRNNVSCLNRNITCHLKDTVSTSANMVVLNSNNSNMNSISSSPTTVNTTSLSDSQFSRTKMCTSSSSLSYENSPGNTHNRIISSEANCIPNFISTNKDRPKSNCFANKELNFPNTLHLINNTSTINSSLTPFTCTSTTTTISTTTAITAAVNTSYSNNTVPVNVTRTLALASTPIHAHMCDHSSTSPAILHNPNYVLSPVVAPLPTSISSNISISNATFVPPSTDTSIFSPIPIFVSSSLPSTSTTNGSISTNSGIVVTSPTVCSIAHVCGNKSTSTDPANVPLSVSAKASSFPLLSTTVSSDISWNSISPSTKATCVTTLALATATGFTGASNTHSTAFPAASITFNSVMKSFPESVNSSYHNSVNLPFTSPLRTTSAVAKNNIITVCTSAEKGVNSKKTHMSAAYACAAIDTEVKSIASLPYKVSFSSVEGLSCTSVPPIYNSSVVHSENVITKASKENIVSSDKPLLQSDTKVEHISPNMTVTNSQVINSINEPFSVVEETTDNIPQKVEGLTNTKTTTPKNNLVVITTCATFTTQIDINEGLRGSHAVPYMTFQTGPSVMVSHSSVATTAIHTPICVSRPFVNSLHLSNSSVSISAKSPLLKNEIGSGKTPETITAEHNICTHTKEPTHSVNNLDNARTNSIFSSNVDRVTPNSEDLYFTNNTPDLSKQADIENLTNDTVKVNSTADTSSKENMCVNNEDTNSVKPAVQVSTVNVSVLSNPSESSCVHGDSVSVHCSNNCDNVKNKGYKKPVTPDGNST